MEARFKAAADDLIDIGVRCGDHDGALTIDAYPAIRPAKAEGQYRLLLDPNDFDLWCPYDGTEEQTCRPSWMITFRNVRGPATDDE